MGLLSFLTWFNLVVVVVMTAAYLYQGIYTIIGLIKRKAAQLPEPKKMHHFAALICARNEEGVIAELVRSLKEQNYPSDLFDIYVLADNCTDATADVARQAGALVYERFNKTQVGKGYALDYLLAHIKAERPGVFDGFFIFDADNIVDSQFVREMNKTFDSGYKIVTCYRNSKNFGSDWISASNSIWFLREARFLNYPRMLMDNSCAVSGTGFLVSSEVIKANDGWPFHLLTEDIQFSVNCAISGYKIGYCDRAIVYDEQPTRFSQSWNQRLRWSKGFFQVDAKYLIGLVNGTVKRQGNRMSCYDMFMTVAPCMFVTLAALVINVVALGVCLTQPYHIMLLIGRKALRYVGFAFFNYYIGMLLYGVLTVWCEWDRIHASGWEKIKYLWTFPLFMATYIPITLQALMSHVEWTHIEHYPTQTFAVPAAKVN